MIVIKLRGGLGNQLFQYAFGLAMSKQYNTNLKFDLRLFKSDDYTSYKHHNRIFKLKYFHAKIDELNFLETVKVDHFKNIFNYIYFNEGGSFANSPLNLNSKNIIFEGFWQTENYFKKYEKEVRNNLQFKYPIQPQYLSYKNLIEEKKVVSVHVRRGDYVKVKSAKDRHGLCSIDYYKSGIDYLVEKKGIDHVLVFSDDIEWCKIALDFELPTTYIDVKDSDDLSEMQLMKNCSNFIIANSSFSWWGAWLSSDPNKVVIAPKNWFQDSTLDSSQIVPEKWILM